MGTAVALGAGAGRLAATLVIFLISHRSNSFVGEELSIEDIVGIALERSG
jgi:hypothetical protein